ncbi:MAG: hypothetical protein C6P35_03440 [Cohnella sp.]|nr:MAG: hypothetical protein C6P35_03440 [Cohnella sp.]
MFFHLAIVSPRYNSAFKFIYIIIGLDFLSREWERMALGSLMFPGKGVAVSMMALAFRTARERFRTDRTLRYPARSGPRCQRLAHTHGKRDDEPVRKMAKNPGHAAGAA